MVSEDLSGRVLGGRYRLVRRLGEGGMGAVYEAVQLDLQRKVAVKVLHPSATNPEGLQRFQREARSAAALRNTHIVQVTDFQVNAAEPAFLVMELLDGLPLSDAIDAEGRIEPLRLARIGRQVLHALAAAHAAGIVHRDIKPENVFLCPSPTLGETVKLVDFGIAKLERDGLDPLTREGLVIGSILYMSPEQASGSETDARSDIFSLGACMYYALSGRLPFQGNNALAVLRSLALGRVDPLAKVAPHVDPELAAVVEQALSPDPDRRPQSAEAMGAALDAWIRCRELGPSQPYPILPGSLIPSPEIRDTSPSAFEATAMTPASGAHALGATTPSGPPQFVSSPPPTGHTGTTAVTVPPRTSRGPLVFGAGLGIAGFAMGAAAIVYVATRPSGLAVPQVPPTSVDAGAVTLTPPSAAPSASPTPAIVAEVRPTATNRPLPPHVVSDAGRRSSSKEFLCMKDSECGSRGQCVSGKCACMPGWDACDGRGCFNLSSNDNCGACGVKCGADEKCAFDPAQHKTRCVNCATLARVTFDSFSRYDHCFGDAPNWCTNVNISNIHCGSCDNRCQGGDVCRSGACVAP